MNISANTGMKVSGTLLILIALLLGLAIVAHLSTSAFLGMYLGMFLLLLIPVFIQLKGWWVPLIIGLIILLPGPLDRTLIAVQLTPEEGYNPYGLFSVIDILMFLSIVIHFAYERNLKGSFDATVNYLTLCLMAITVLACISTIFSAFNSSTFYLPMALRGIFYSIRFLLVFAWVKLFFKDISYVRQMPYAIFIITLGFVLLAVLSPSDNYEGGNRLSVATYGVNTFGHLLTFVSLLCIPFISHFYASKRYMMFLLALGSLVICFTFQLMSANRMSFGLLLMGAGIYYLYLPIPFRKKMRLAFFMLTGLVMCVGVFFVFKPDLFERIFGIFQLVSGENALEDVKELQARFVVWGLSYNMIVEHPFLGVGPGQWNYLKDYFGTMPPWMTSILDPHNGYLLYASEMGLICVMIYYSVIFTTIRRGIKAFKILKQQYKIKPSADLSLYLSFILILNVIIVCWLLSDLTNASGLNIRVQSLMWSLCSICFIAPSLARKYIHSL
ncbi:O-antigen ligase family protein [Terrimonas sp. NA20]|uniref:O-antigen ligase family protein n=1 Tax=Terrimonas ginsenosidimutans TaxID=2908004 RepID=A0ABS9KUQ7_9BACT|nr:O-antigen ligase family protein [Terrimonas ginsenosidimutans]MCG2616079.1 O-antigen ligase family protein [Terrimonas ginsenosidimutans]